MPAVIKVVRYSMKCIFNRLTFTFFNMHQKPKGQLRERPVDLTNFISFELVTGKLSFKLSLV